MLRIVCAGATLIVAATTLGCSSSRAGQAEPGSASSSGASSTTSAGDRLPYAGAPRVDNPLDVDKFKQDPCAVLTAQQLRSLDVRAQGKFGSSALGPTCTWQDDYGPSGAGFDANFLVGGTGLSGIYNNRGKKLLFFQEIPPVQGYPAVIAGPDDARSKGICELSVGLNDRQILDVSVTMRGEPDPAPNFRKPCAVAQKLAEEMVKTIKGGV